MKLLRRYDVKESFLMFIRYFVELVGNSDDDVTMLYWSYSLDDATKKYRHYVKQSPDCKFQVIRFVTESTIMLKYAPSVESESKSEAET